MREMQTVLFIEPSEICWYGLHFMLKDQRYEIRRTPTVGSCIKLLLGSKPTSIIIDPAGSAFSEAIDLVKNYHQYINFMFFTNLPEIPYAELALNAGASGFCSKNVNLSLFMKYINNINDGKLVLSDKMMERQEQRINSRSKQNVIENLTPRELDVFIRVGNAKNNKQISNDLCLSSKTVETYKEMLKTKLGLKSVSELIRFAALWLHEHTGTVHV